MCRQTVKRIGHDIRGTGVRVVGRSRVCDERDVIPRNLDLDLGGQALERSRPNERWL